MNIKKVGIPSILPDNDTAYLTHVIKCISIIDNDAELIISKSISGYGFTLKFSREEHKEILIKEVKAAHFTLGLEATMTHFKNSPYITFRLTSL